MNPNECVNCIGFPCLDVNKDCYLVPNVEVNTDKIRALMVSEAPPTELQEYFYAEGNPFYMQTTAQAFKDAGFEVTSMDDVLDLGVYVTTAIKCGKTGYSVSSKTVENCSSLLEKELDLLGKRIVPSGSTYRIRKNDYFYNDVRVFPTYLQTGKSYLIEKSKRKMIAEDIKTALKKNVFLPSSSIEF